jgi:hypothetical protein
MKYTIDRAYLTSVTIHESWSAYDNKSDLTEEELVKVLKGLDRCSTIRDEDHPEFARLRDTLEQDGCIETNRLCWNGDQVIKNFQVNNTKFKIGDRFLCAAASKFQIK